MNKINEATFFLFKSEKKTDDGYLKQMREGLRNIFLFGLSIQRVKLMLNFSIITFLFIYNYFPNKQYRHC